MQGAIVEVTEGQAALLKELSQSMIDALAALTALTVFIIILLNGLIKYIS